MMYTYPTQTTFIYLIFSFTFFSSTCFFSIPIKYLFISSTHHLISSSAILLHPKDSSSSSLKRQEERNILYTKKSERRRSSQQQWVYGFMLELKIAHLIQNFAIYLIGQKLEERKRKKEPLLLARCNFSFGLLVIDEEGAQSVEKFFSYMMVFFLFLFFYFFYRDLGKISK